MNRVPLRHQVSHQGILRPEVEDVVLVGARRDDHQRRWNTFAVVGVLDELDQLVLEDDLPRCDSEVAAHLEGGVIGHRHPPLCEVLGEQAHASGTGPLTCPPPLTPVNAKLPAEMAKLGRLPVRPIVTTDVWADLDGAGLPARRQASKGCG